MTLIKTSMLNGIAVIIKMLTLLGLNKILAIYVGPSGYAALGQFQNAVQMITTFASGAINTGVTKYTAEFHQDEEMQRTVWRTAGTIATFGSFIAAILVIIFNSRLAEWFLQDKRFGSVFVWFGAMLALFVFNTLLLAILNGKKDIKRYVIANIAGSLLALVITSIMAIQLGLYGALISLAIYQSLTFFVTLALIYKAPWFKFSYLIGNVDGQVAKNLAKYTMMALSSAVCVPFSQILIRNHLGETLGWNAAGYWEAMWRLSAAYLMLVTTTLSLYYLPRLSELKKYIDIKREILSGYKIILPIAALSSCIIYFARNFFVDLLFSTEFSRMEELFLWQMIGDTLKIGSWVLSYVMLGQALVKLYIITELIFSILFVLLTFWLTDVYGLKGVSVAHATNYAIYWIAMFFFIKRELSKKG